MKDDKMHLINKYLIMKQLEQFGIKKVTIREGDVLDE